ncbi:MAG TPA: rhodanese-like domain-containing protein [Chitinophagaceae bacterium]|nr:rhodanese-like domain-containing protein [Chitinophagaceae bacterium]
MMGFFRNLLGAAPDSNIEQLLKKGATIVDVRTEREYISGHVRGSMNIPLDKLQKNISKLKKNKPIITCCASGIRSATAKKILMNSGFTDVHNGGSWTNVQRRAN